MTSAVDGADMLDASPEVIPVKGVVGLGVDLNPCFAALTAAARLDD